MVALVGQAKCEPERPLSMLPGRKKRDAPKSSTRLIATMVTVCVISPKRCSSAPPRKAPTMAPTL